MADEILTRTRYGEAFWRAQHEAWRRSELNQREYCSRSAPRKPEYRNGLPCQAD